MMMRNIVRFGFTVITLLTKEVLQIVFGAQDTKLLIKFLLDYTMDQI